MAMRCSSSPVKIIQVSTARARARGSMKSGVFMIHSSQTTVAQKLLSVEIIRHSPTNKVFEDQPKGIVCYKDADGELICEGCDDEDPRPSPEVPTPTPYHGRELGIVNLLLSQSSFQMFQDDKWISLVE